MIGLSFITTVLLFITQLPFTELSLSLKTSKAQLEGSLRIENLLPDMLSNGLLDFKEREAINHTLKQ